MQEGLTEGQICVTLYYRKDVDMIKPLKPLNVRIPDELQKQLQAISKREGTPVSDLVRESLQRFVVVRRFRQLRKQVLPFAEAQGFLTDEDIFQQIS